MLHLFRYFKNNFIGYVWMTIFYNGLKTYNLSWVDHTSIALEAKEIISDS